MEAGQAVDLSAGFVPKSGGVDLSAGMVPKSASTGDVDLSAGLVPKQPLSTSNIPAGHIAMTDEHNNLQAVPHEHAQERLTAGWKIGPPAQTHYASAQEQAKPAAATPQPAGLRQPGNINLTGRPILHNQDGTISSEKSFSIGTDKGETLLPLIVDGKELTQQQAIDHYRKTGEHMGIFDTPENADAYATQVHNRKLAASGGPVYVYQGEAKHQPQNFWERLGFPEGTGQDTSSQQPPPITPSERNKPVDFAHPVAGDEAGGGPGDLTIEGLQAGREKMAQAGGDIGAAAGEKTVRFAAKHFQDDPNATPGEIGAARGTGRFVGSTVADPATPALIATGAEAGPLGKAALSAIFTGIMAKGSIDTAGKVGEIWDREDIPQQDKVELATQAILSTIAAGTSGAHGVKETFSPDSPLLSRVPDAYKMTLAQRINQAIKQPLEKVDTSHLIPKKFINAVKAATTRTAAQKLGTAVKPADVGTFQNAASVVMPDVKRAESRLGITISSSADALTAITDALKWTNDPQRTAALKQLESGIKEGQQRVKSQRPQSLFTRTIGSASDPQARLAAYDQGIAKAFSSLSAPSATPNPAVQLSTGSTATVPGSQTAASGGMRPIGGRVGEFTSIPEGVTPEQEPKQIPLTTSVPGLTLAGKVTAARPGTGRINPHSPIPAPEPVQPQMDFDATRPRPLNVAPVETPAEPQQPPQPRRDIFQNDQEMEDWLQRQEDSSPRIQQARQRAQRIRDAREAPAENPGEVAVPRGQHPEDVIANKLMSSPLSRVRATAKELGISVTAADDHKALIPQIMDRISDLDSQPETAGLMQSMVEHFSGARGEIPARPATGEAENPDLSDVMSRSLDAVNARKQAGARGGPVELRKPENASFRDTLQNMSPEEKDAALESYHQRERTSPKTGLPNELAFNESEATLGKSHPHIGFADADDFKLLNDTFDHKYVDEKVLRPIGELMAAAAQRENGAVHAFHISGDEFMFRASDPAAITRVVNHINAQMAGARFEVEKPDGAIVTREGVGLSHGQGFTQAEAEANAAKDKTERRLSGQRTGARDADREAAQNQNPTTAQPPQREQNSQSNAPERQGVLASGVRPAASLRPGEAHMVPTADLHADPERFQYKGGTNEQGVTNALKEQNSYDQNKGGVLLVWKDPANGKVYVVNGHHRFELAQRAGEENVLARMIDAPDAEAAKVIGAETNISEGHGSIVDAARFFKSAKISTVADAAKRNLPMGQAKVTDGLAMARLDNSILDRVESGDIPEGRAVAIGKITDSPAQQDATLQAIAKRETRTGKTLTEGETESIARQVRDADTHVEQGQDLFGMFSREESLFGEQAEIDDYILRQLRNDKRTFGAVASKTRAETLGKVKNQQINAEENQRISEQAAQAEALYNKLVNRAGPLNEIRKNAAKELAQRYSKPQEVKAKAYDRIRQELQGQLGTGGDATGTEGKRQ